MLSAKSDREKITITIKKENKKILEQMAESENRNLSRQIDYLIESYFPVTEEELLRMVEQSKTSKRYTSEEARKMIGNKNEI